MSLFLSVPWNRASLNVLAFLPLLLFLLSLSYAHPAHARYMIIKSLTGVGRRGTVFFGALVCTTGLQCTRSLARLQRELMDLAALQGRSGQED